METEINIPDFACRAIEILEKNGFEAYCVGGCVRDSLLGKTPNDWDICTNALPHETKEAFAGYSTIETGIKHGTLTVIIEGNHLEITTYRTDGEYENHRKPRQVKFVPDLKGDLSRRDFTVNAMCVNPKSGLVDMFGGKADLERKIIRCVGNPEERFEEDALRILRALRFASTLGFTLEENTAVAVKECRGLLKFISAERIYSELKKLLCGKGAVEILLNYREVFGVFLPEIERCFDFEQNNPHHIYTVWEHICRSVGYSRPDEKIRLAMLFHDIGKPDMATVDSNGINHFKQHQFRSEQLTADIFRRLKSDKATASYVLALIREHDNRIPAEKRSVKRFISKYSYGFYMDYLEVRRADTYAQSDYLRKQKLEELDRLGELGIELKEENSCLKIADLAVNGKDLMEMGLEGKAIGEALKSALEGIISDEIANDRDTICKFIKEKFL